MSIHKPAIFLLWLAAAFARAEASEQTDLMDVCRQDKHIEDRNMASPVVVRASRMTFNFNEKYLTGDNISVCQDGGILEAQSLTYNLKSDLLDLSDNISLTVGELTLGGSRGHIDLNDRSIRLEQASYRFDQDEGISYYGEAETISYENETLSAVDAWVTTCEPDKPDWSVAARRLELSQDDLWIKTRHILLKVRKAPIFYLPWLYFPLNSDRKSGFLPPEIGVSDGGLEVATPYYFNLAPNYDATLTPRWHSHRGPQVEAEFRHLSRYSINELTGHLIFQDKLFRDEQREEGKDPDTERWYWNWKHSGQWGNRLYTQVDYSRTSDIEYLNDFRRSTRVRNRDNISRFARIGYRYKSWDLSLNTQRFRFLDDRLQQPYDLVSELNLNHFAEYRKGWQLEASANLTHFRRNTSGITDFIGAFTGRRLSLRSVLSHQRKFAAGSLRFRLGWRHNYYDTHNSVAAQRTDRSGSGGPLFSIESRLSAQRYGTFRQSRYIQTLEPRIYYLYSNPSSHQQRRPLFDTKEYAPSFEYLFRENTFVGSDRINDANRLAIGVTTRFLNAQSGHQWASLSLGSGVNFTPPKVGLNDNGPTYDGSLAPLIGNASLAFSERLKFSLQWVYDRGEADNAELSAGTHLKFEKGRLFNVGFRKKNSHEQVSLSGFLPLSQNFHLVGSWRYDLDTQKDTESLFGFEYRDCCWRFRIGVHSVLEEDGLFSRSENIFFVGFELVGVGGNIDSLSNRLYRRLIYGFEKE